MDSRCNGGDAGGPKWEEALNSNGSSSRKRIKLLETTKELEICTPVGPALVPRRLRSAIKRVSQSASPPSSDVKSKKLHVSNGTPLFKGSGAEKLKKKMLDEITKDEKEVAEALTFMSNLIKISNPAKPQDMGLLQKSTEKTAPSASLLEAPREEGKKCLVPCNGTQVTSPFSCVEQSPGIRKADPPAEGKPIATPVLQTLEAEPNVPSQQEPLSSSKLSSKSVDVVRNLKDPSAVVNPQGASLRYLPGSGTLQGLQFNALLLHKPELWPLGPTTVEHDQQSLKKKPQGVLNDVKCKAPDGHREQEKLTMPAMNKAASFLNPITVSERSAIRSSLATEKLSQSPADNKRPWSTCTTHVRISHLIRDCQKAEKKQQSLPQANQPRAKEGASCSLRTTSSETVKLRNGMLPPPSSIPLVERSLLDAKDQKIQEGRILQAQHAAALQLKQGPDLRSSSISGDTKSSRNGMRSSGQLQFSYPFPFPPGSYTQYQEQLAAGATNQVQLQIPASYIANGQLYGSHMGHSTKQQQLQQQQQQQLMWQAHMAHYRPPVCFPQKWQQNGRQHESSSSSMTPPSIFPLVPEYNPSNLHHPFILPVPPPSSSVPKQRPQHNGSGGLNPQSSPQLQVVCNAESYR